MKDLCNLFANNLKAKRHALGLTQKDLADKISYSTKAISKWEAAHALPPTAVLPELARLLQTTVDELLSPPRATKYFLGIAGYDERFDLMLCDADARVLKSLTLDTVTPTLIGLEKTQKKLTDAIFRIAGDLKFSEIAVSVGIDGIYRLGKSEINSLLHDLGFATVRVFSNYRNGIEVTIGNGSGIFVNLGYGSAVFAKSQSPKLHRIGGYGHMIGDPFSALSLGQAAVRAVLLAQDGIGSANELEKAIRDITQIFEGRLPSVIFSDRLLLCHAANAVFTAYASGDTVAEGILRNNAEELAMLINASMKHLNPNEAKVILYGQLCEYKDIILPLIENALRKYNNSFTVGVNDTPAVYGALKLAGLKKDVLMGN